LKACNLIDFLNLNREQVGRDYKMVSDSGSQCFFILANVASVIQNKFEYSALNEKERAIDNIIDKRRLLET